MICGAYMLGSICTLPQGHDGDHELWVNGRRICGWWNRHDAVVDGRQLFENDGGMLEETRALRALIFRWHGAEMNGLKRIADDFKFKRQVSGGPFASEQTMGWHITDDNGFTLAVCCDATFVEAMLAAVDLVNDILGRDPVIYAGEYAGQGNDACSTCYYCGTLPHTGKCVWLLLKQGRDGASPELKQPKHERRQDGVRSVRQWFREMRAADFARDILRTGFGYETIHRGQKVRIGGEKPWTLFDTLQVVDRVTAAHYPDPDVEYLSVAAWADIENRDDLHRWYGTPAVLMGIEPTYREGNYFGIDRSTYPTFSSKVPTSSRGITQEDVERFVREDDAARPSRCARCGSAKVRVVPAPMGYVGPGSGSLLYHYAKLVSPDTRYTLTITDGPRVKMCDACRHAEVLADHDWLEGGGILGGCGEW